MISLNSCCHPQHLSLLRELAMHCCMPLGDSRCFALTNADKKKQTLAASVRPLPEGTAMEATGAQERGNTILEGQLLVACNVSLIEC